MLVYLEHIAMARSYGILVLGRGKIVVCLRNHGAKQITLHKWTAVGEIAAGSIILALLAPKPTGHEAEKDGFTGKKGRTESPK